MNSPKIQLFIISAFFERPKILQVSKWVDAEQWEWLNFLFRLRIIFLLRNIRKSFFSSYLQSFKGIGHTSLIKLNKLPVPPHSTTIPYFIELETIEGSSKNLTYFAYYYGYVYIQKEGNAYKIADITLIGEDFLCAAYHLWQHNAEAVVDIEYGEWCKLVKKRLPTKKEGYIKKIDIIGTDGRDYRFIFFQLTNDTDLLVSQYRKNPKGTWEWVKIEPESCLRVKEKFVCTFI